MKPGTARWIKTFVFALLGGGISAVVNAAMDPTRYRFPHDLGSGKMWLPFFSGVAVTFVAILMKSPRS